MGRAFRHRGHCVAGAARGWAGLRGREGERMPGAGPEGQERQAKGQGGGTGHAWNQEVMDGDTVYLAELKPLLKEIKYFQIEKV